MRKIRKTEPPEYATWRAEQEAPPRSDGHPDGYTYESLPSLVKAAIRKGLYDEQGGLDAYTGERLKLGDEEDDPRRLDDGFHIEHMYPQAYCSDAEAVDYKNMVACKPGERDQIKHLPYGARHKDRYNPESKPWPAEEQRYLFVLPTSPTAEARFTYTRSGFMKPSDSTDEAALCTIEAINLSGNTSTSRSLRDNRAAVYRGATRDGRLSLRDAKNRLKEIADQENSRQALAEFLPVEKQALQKHLTRVQHARAHKRTNR